MSEAESIMLFLAIMFTFIGILLIWLGFATEGSGCGCIVFGILFAIFGIWMLINSLSDSEPTAEEIAQVRENYIEAYENTVILEDYSVSSNVSFKQNGLFDGEITISGICQHLVSVDGEAKQELYFFLCPRLPQSVQDTLSRSS